MAELFSDEERAVFAERATDEAVRSIAQAALATLHAPPEWVRGRCLAVTYGDKSAAAEALGQNNGQQPGAAITLYDADDVRSWLPSLAEQLDETCFGVVLAVATPDGDGDPFAAVVFPIAC
jgi:hypothetical protein